jgi:DNA-binding Lrp family transcriptional regulator
VGLSQEAVRYRINSLIKIGVIKSFLTILDISKIGFTFYKILIKLHNIDEPKLKNIITSLKENKAISWLATLEGDYHLGIVVKAKNIWELNITLENIDKDFSHYISKRVFSVNLFGEYLDRNYLLDTKRINKNIISYTTESNKEKTDSKDLDIIKELTRDGRINAVDIAKKLKISPDTVLQRKKRLEKEGIITRYSIVLDHNKLNQTHYKVLIYLNDFSPQKISDFVNFCKTKEQIVYIIKALGEWNYELDIEVKTLETFRQTMMELTNRFSDIIKDYSSLIVREIHKYNYYP